MAEVKHGAPVESGAPSRKQKKRYRNDIILIAAVLLAAVGAFLFLYLTRGEGQYVEISVDGQVTAVYPLHEDRTVAVPFGNGSFNRVEIRDGQVKVTDADCPDRICVAHPPISRDGESIVCLPHRLVVSVRAGNPGEVEP